MSFRHLNRSDRPTVIYEFFGLRQSFKDRKYAFCGTDFFFQSTADMIKETKDRIATKEATDIMLSDITGIRLTGGNFTSPTDLSFFNTNQKQAIIIYGKNGAGKSTIAKAVKAISTQSLPSTIQQAEFFNKNKKSINLSDEERERIYVFDEEFVDKNI